MVIDTKEEALLKEALDMSEAVPTGDIEQADDDMPNFAAMTEDEQIAYAMRMSMDPAGRSYL